MSRTSASRQTSRIGNADMLTCCAAVLRLKSLVCLNNTTRIKHPHTSAIGRIERSLTSHSLPFLSFQICQHIFRLFFENFSPFTKPRLPFIMGMKWFNLPGAKEAYIQDAKREWVNDQDISIPWINLRAKSAKIWELFTLAFPDQAWIISQIRSIDRNIDDTLASLDRLVPTTCKAKSWYEPTTSDVFFPYYQDPTLGQHQRELILHYANVLTFSMYDITETDRLRLKTFRSTCIELVETSSLRDRAKLIRELLSRENTTALLSTQPSGAMPVWDVRREAFHRGLMIEKAMKKMSEALGLKEDDDENEDEDDEDEDATDDKMADDIHGSESEDLQYGRSGSEGPSRVNDLCTKEHKFTTDENLAPGLDADRSRCDLPLRGSSTGGTTTTVDHVEHAVEGEWTSVM